MAKDKGKIGLFSPEFIEFFYAQVRAVKHPDACWIWTGTVDGHGFGTVKFGDKKRVAAHRVAWELENGPLPPNTIVRHDCNARPCCRVDHLRLQDANARESRNDGLTTNVKNLEALTPSIFVGTDYNTGTSVNVVYGDDAAKTVDVLSPLLSQLGRAVVKCVSLQTDVMAALSQARDQREGILDRLASMLAEIEDLQSQLSEISPTTEVSRETSEREHHAPPPVVAADVSRETSATTAADHARLNAQFALASTHSRVQKQKKPDPEPPLVSERLRFALAQVVAQALGVSAEQLDSYAVAQVYELAVEREGIHATAAMRGWVERFADLVELGQAPPTAVALLRWAVDLTEDASAGPVPGGATELVPASCPGTPDTPPASSPRLSLAPGRPDPRPAEPSASG